MVIQKDTKIVANTQGLFIRVSKLYKKKHTHQLEKRRMSRQFF